MSVSQARRIALAARFTLLTRPTTCNARGQRLERELRERTVPLDRIYQVTDVEVRIVDTEFV
jgi:hypothetical protein